MSFAKLFPRALAACFVLAFCAADASAQIDISRPRQVSTSITDNGTPTLENEPVVISVAPVEDLTDASPKTVNAARQTHLQQMLLAAIEMRIGTPYRLGSSGPTRYDCSGFVWSVFQSAGINFERTSARSLWQSFAPARDDERFKFGTLVFFNNLNHIGIVADEHGFYHASTSQGVVYSPFNEYWTERIVGFRRAPAATPELFAVVK
ncbi:MAG TPA: C40 family peptidase [Pyrinomonadaceae bacterium]|jgi:peptidoglycan endopeptidase LytE|nr:C40 family peptidase [Pyrinomonadaceae bacterium]